MFQIYISEISREHIDHCLKSSDCIQYEFTGIFKQSMGAKNRLGIGLSYWPVRLHRLAEIFLGIDSWAP
jgi:hypothetical protein